MFLRSAAPTNGLTKGLDRVRVRVMVRVRVRVIGLECSVLSLRS